MSASAFRFAPDDQTAFAARFEAQKIIFAPVVFQCLHYAWSRGLLDALAEAGAAGRSVSELAASGRWREYALKIVLESCMSAGVVSLDGERYQLDTIGYCLIADRLTQINFRFIKDVCYRGLDELAASLDAEQPLGLKTLGDWPSIYPVLSQLPEPAKASWFAFDHLYSDNAFPEILPDVFATAPSRLLDVGANTGKFAAAALGFRQRVELHLLDLPGQLAVAKSELERQGFASRAQFHPQDLLESEAPFPAGMDLVWMSQFLSCFSEAQVLSILRRAHKALNAGGQLLVLDTFWDRQQYPIASFCLINTSPYFTTMASGNSKIYRFEDYRRLAEQAGFELLTVRDRIGYGHSLLRFGRAD